jgi:phosphoglycolate phosphatase
MIKLVIIDFDDTLCMTEEACFQLENEVASKMGFPTMTRDSHKKNWGKPLETAILERIPGINSDNFMSILTALLPSYVKKGKLDIITQNNLLTLDNLLRNGFLLAILTSRTRSEVKHLINKNHPLQSYIHSFYYKENSFFRKPDPRVFQKILKKFHIKPPEAVYVGDTLSDEVCAKDAELYFIASLESGLKSKTDFDRRVDYFINKFSELPKALEYLNK